MRDIRLGDDIDDFCVRCKRIMNHAVVSVIDGAPAKVRCRTCHSDHDYRHEQPPPPKVDSRKAALFNEVLKKVSPDGAAAASEAEEIPDAEIETDSEEMNESESATAEMAEVESAPAATEEAKPKARAKVKAKTKK